MTTRTLPTGTVTLLLTDIEGSTVALRELGADYGASLELHRALVRDAVERHGGVEVDTQGDAFLIAFARADDALDTAGALTRSLDAVDWPHGVPLRARLGIHTGQPERAAEGYVGLDLHRAARICSSANGGQVVVSAATRALGGDRVFVDLGHHLLKGFNDPERLFQLVVEEGASFPPLRTKAATNLPAVPNAFVNRDAELAELRRLLVGGTRLVTLVGSGGAGKSRLALEAAHAILGDLAHGVHLTRLAPIDDPDLVPAAIATALGIAPGENASEAVVDFLRERESLLVLDNLEHLPAAAAFVGLLIDEAPRLSVIATSRGPLRIAGEHVIPVDPLLEDPAMRLFAERARSADGRFTLDDRVEEDVREVCRRVDGLPLAIEIAAARVTSVSVRDMAAGIGFSLRTSGARDAADRHRTLEAAISWGTSILDESLRRLHASLAVFQGRFTPEAAAFAFGASHDDLAALVEAALLRRVDDGGTTRLGMLRTVREFALERLMEAGRLAETRERRALWIENLASRAADTLDEVDPAAWLAELEHWLPDIRATLRDASSAGDHARCVRITAALERFWRARGDVDEARVLLAAALAAAPPDEPEARARAAWTLARLTIAQGDPRGARIPLLEALALFESVGASRDTAFALTELAWVALDLGELEEADSRASTALQVARAAEDERAASSALSARATVASERGEAAAARSYAEESLAIRRRLGDRQLIANATLTLGSAALADDDLDAASVSLAECLELATEIGDALHEAGARCCLGEIAALRGDRVGAVGQLLPALASFVRLGNDAAAAECLVALAATLDDPAAAGRMLGAATAARERVGVAPLPVERRLEERARSIVPPGSADESAGRQLSPVEAALLAGADPTRI